ncbi:MAG TPA: hypothetical protein VFU53_03520 [Burkholderiales bacterium]|nr:hypothetical protein [Burkholderiales bacterium]
MKSSEHYLSKAAELAERAEQQTHSREAMAALTALGQFNLELARTLAEREAAGLEPVTAPEPVAVMDCHDRRWDRGPDGRYAHPAYAMSVTYEYLAKHAGPLRPAEVSK